MRARAQKLVRQRSFALPGLASLLAIYVVLHSPARTPIAALFTSEVHACYFCIAAYPVSQVGVPLAGLGFVAVALLAAWALADEFDGPGFEWPLAFGLLGLAFVTVPAAVLGGIAYWLQQPMLRPPLGPFLAALPGAFVLAARLRAGWRPRLASWPSGSRPRLPLVVGTLALGLLVAAIAVGLAHPPTGGDALTYHAPLAVLLWQDGNLATFLDRVAPDWSLAHPGTAELWFGLLHLVGGESLADLGQLPFVFLGAAAAAAFSRRLGLGRAAALLAAGAFVLIPMTVLQMTTQANDVVGAALLMSSMALASAPYRTWTPGRFAVIGIGLGLVAATKLALLPCVAGVALYIAWAAAWPAPVRRPRGVRRIFPLAILAVTFLVVVAPWWVRNVLREGNPLYPAALPLLGRGVVVADFGPVDTSFVPHPLAWPLYPFVEAHDDRSGFGALALGVLPGLAVTALLRPRPPILLYTLVLACMLPAWWIFTLHEPRFFLGPVGLGLGFVPWVLTAVPRRLRHVGAAGLAFAATFSAAVTLDQGLLPLAIQPTSRWEFYDRVWGVDPVAAALPESDGLLFATGFAPRWMQEYAAYYPLLGGAQGRLVVPLDAERSTTAIMARMRAANLRYAYVVSSAETQSAVDAAYDPGQFQLVQASTIERGENSGARRYLYRPAIKPEQAGAIRRALYRLR